MIPRRGRAPEIIFFTARYRLKALDTAMTRYVGFRSAFAQGCGATSLFFCAGE